MNPLDAWTFDSGLYLANVAAAATLACASALAAARILKSRPAPVRYGVLLAAMLLALLSPGMAWTARALGLSPLCISAPVPEKIAEAVAPMVEPIALPPTPETPMMPAPLGPVLPPPAEPVLEAAPPTVPLPWPQILLAAAALVWSAGTAVCLVFLVRGLVLVQRLRRSLRPARDARLGAAAIRAACTLGLLKLPRICVSDLVPAPLSLGLARPAIVMPEGLAETLSDTDLEAVVLHEAAHIAHRDHWVGLMQRVVLSLFWWNPLVRMLSDRLSAAREEVCDNYVVRAQGDGLPFAQFLVRMAGRLTACRRLTAAIGLVQEPRRGLEERIRGLLRKERNTMTRMNLAAMALVGAFALGLGGLMLLSTIGAAEEADDTEAAPADAGEAVGGLRLSLTVPCEKEYGGRMTLPLLLVLKNVGDAQAAPADLRWGPPAIEAVDAGGRPVRVRDLIDITPWEGRLEAGAIPPGAAVPWMLWFDRFSFLDPLRPDTTLRVRVRLGGAGGLASNWVTLGIKSSGPPLLGPGNVPGTWQGFMDLVYREANNLRGYRAIHVDGDGRVTVVAVTGGKDPLLGRHEIVLAKADLDALADLLNRQWAWALHAVKQETAYPDEPTVALSLSSAGNLMAGEWPMRTVRQTPALLAIQQAMVRLMEKTVAAAKAAQHGWGPLSDDGVQARLRADSASWKAAETPTFRADVRNLGMRELFVAAAQQLCELEVDANWYQWVGEISVISGAFGPGREYGDVPVVLDDKWKSKEGAKPLHLEAGRHTVRIAFIASPQDRSAGPPARAVSNPVEIEILPKEAQAGSFGIYLVTAPAGLQDAENMPLDKLELATKPVIGAKDLVSYDWDTHLLHLRPGVRAALRRQFNLHTAFVVLCDGKRIYLGAFSTLISSYMPGVPVSYVDDISVKDRGLPADAIQINPSPWRTARVAPDPRNDERLHKTLEALGKLGRTTAVPDAKGEEPRPAAPPAPDSDKVQEASMRLDDLWAIAWCPLVRGLQAGTVFGRPHYPYRPGETVTYKIYLSNCMDQPVTLVFQEPAAWVPTVYKERGGQVARELEGLNVDPAPAERTVTLASSEKVLVGTVQLKLDATPEDKPGGPHIYLEPGQYRVNWTGRVKESGQADRFEISACSPFLMVAGPEEAAGAEAPPDAMKPSSVALYLVADPQYAGAAEKIPLADLKLQTKPLFTDKDIVAYYWGDHIIQLTPEAFQTLRRTREVWLAQSCRAFVVVADGQRCYLGAFSSGLASYVPRVPLGYIWTGRQQVLPQNAIRIGPMGYWDPKRPQEQDTRNDPRLRQALAALGKLPKTVAAEVPASGDSAVKASTQSGNGQSLPTTEHGRDLLRKVVSDIGGVDLVLEYWNEKGTNVGGPRRSLALRGTESFSPEGWLSVPISEAQAGQVVAKLAQLGVLDGLTDHTYGAGGPVPEWGPSRPKRVPGYLLHVLVLGKATIGDAFVDLSEGGDEAVAKILSELRADLTGQAADAADVVLKELGKGTPATQPAAQPAEKIAWGEAVDGLQTGLSFDLQDRAYPVGESVSFRLYARNRGPKAVELIDFVGVNPPRDNALLIGWAPTVHDAEGNRVPIEQPRLDIPVMSRKRQVMPGQTMLVGTVGLRIGGLPLNRNSVTDLRADLKPGTYRVSQTYRFADHPESTWSGELTTGELTLSVAEPDPATQPATPATLQVGEGRVRLQSGDTAVEGERLTIEDGRLDATGDVVLQSGNDRLRADKLEARTAAPPATKIVSDIPVLRDGDQGINTLDLSATVQLGQAPLGLRVLYERPDRRALWIVDPASGVPLLVLAEGKALLYDVVNRSVTVMPTRQVPSFRLRQIGEDFKVDFGTLDATKDREPAILVDAASVLNLESNTLTFGMQPDGERWVEAVSARGNTARAVLDASAAYPVRRFEITAKGQQAPGLRVDIQVNQPVPASLLSMPDLEVLASRMELKRLDARGGTDIGEAMASVQDFIKTAQGSLIARFAVDSAEHRRELEKSLGRSIDWDAVRKFDAQAIEAFRQAGALLPPAPPPTKQLPATGPEADRPGEELKALRQSLARPAEYGLPKKSLPAVERLVEIGSAEAVQVLYEALTDPRVSRKVKLHALPALGRIGSDEALNAYRDYQRWANEFPRDRPFEFGPHENPMDHFADQDVAPLVKWSAGSGQTQREFAAFRWHRYGETRLWLVSRKPLCTWFTPGLLAMAAGDAGRIGNAEHLTGVYDAGRLALKGDQIDLTLEPQTEADDADNDDVPDAIEVMLGTDPNKTDTDGDGIADGRDSNPQTPRPARVNEEMEIRQAAFLALFGTSSTRDAANIAWDAGANRPTDIPEWARQEYYGMGGYVLRSPKIREGWVNITAIEIKRVSPTEALVVIHDYEGNAAASTHEIVVKKMGKLWVPVSVQMTIIS